MKFKDIKKMLEINKKIAKSFEQANLSRIATNISECGQFSCVFECKDCHTQEFKGLETCHNKFCLIDSTIKSRSWLARLFDVLKEELYNGKYINFITFTIRDRENLTEALDILNGAWKKMTNEIRPYVREFQASFNGGGIKSLEVKIGNGSGKWHPHLHVIAIKSNYMYDVRFLQTAWRDCVSRSGGDGLEGRVHIETIYSKNEFGEKQVVDNLSLVRGIVEGVKYISKFNYANESVARLKELVLCLDGVRQISIFGELRKKDIKNKVNKDIQNETIGENSPINYYVEHVCQICGCKEASLTNLITKDIIDCNTERLVLLDNDDFKHLTEDNSPEAEIRRRDLIIMAKEHNGLIKPTLVDPKEFADSCIQQLQFDFNKEMRIK